jgi:putative membrane protein (TIGR04086 family)
VKFVAVLVGAAVGVLILLALVGIPYFILLANGFTDHEIEALIISASSLSPLLELIAALPSMLGGYLAGRMAGYEESQHGLLSALVHCVIVVPMHFSDPSSNPTWYESLRFAPVVIGAGWLGGWLARSRKSAA